MTAASMYETSTGLYMTSQAGQRLRALRKTAGLKQTDIAEAMGYDSVGPISKWENNRDPIPDDRIVDLAEALDVSERHLRTYLYGDDAVQEEDEIASWRDRVAASGLDEGVRFLLLCMPVFADPETYVVAVTREDFAAEMQLDLGRVSRDWDAMLESGFVKPIGSPGVRSQVFKLVLK